MKRALWAVPLLVVIGAWFARGSYSYYYTENGANPNWSNWIVQNYLGQLGVYTYGNYGGIAFDDSGGVGTGRMTYASTSASPGEVKLTLRMAQTGWSSTSVYLSASTDLSAPGASPATGSGYKIRFDSDSTGSSYELSKIVNGQFTTLATGWCAPAHDGMTLRFVRNSNGLILGYFDDVRFLQFTDSSFISGRVAVELQRAFSPVAAGPLVTEIDLGNPDSTAPDAIPSGSISATPFYNHVDMQWPAASDDANGSGIYDYEIYRNGWLVGSTQDLSFADSTVAPSTTYTYSLKPVDFHGNAASTDFVVTTPAFSPEGRRVGVRPTGAYWGASGENIDVLSGNLNFTLPLLTAKARSGWGVGFNLNYNSQNWRYDAKSSWKYGVDVGYGFGWRLMAGSITPRFADAYTVNYYLFTDSTGAEYRLDQNSNNVWSSKESVYVYFDANLNRLWFTNGSWWNFGCVSASGEADSGVMYPTLMQDSNGNEIVVRYQAGAGSGYLNTSARISSIEDVRAIQYNPPASYTFTYTTESTPHLTSIASTILNGENYTFSYLTGQALSAPFNSQAFGTTAMLRDVTITSNNTYHEFTYNGSGELTQVLLPYKGYLGYDYTTTAYPNGLSYREVVRRYLSKDGISSTQYPFSHEPGLSGNIHQFTQLDDPGGVGEKYWAFAASGASVGLVTQYQGRQLPGPVTKIQNDYTWTQDAVGNNYIGSVTTTADPGQSYAAAKKTDQTVDVHGNVTQVKTYDYGNLTTPVRTDNYTYISYSWFYLFNRLWTSPTTTISYDQFALSSAPADVYEWAYTGTSLTGNPTTIVSPAGTQTLHYDFAGGVLTSTVNGLQSSVTSTNATNYAAPSQITVGSLSSGMSYTQFLALTNETDPNGASTSIGYDVMARPSSTTSPFGATTTTTYSDTASPPTVQTSVNGRWTRTTLDGLGRTIKTETGNASGTVSVAETQYDSCGCSPTGKVKQTALPHAPGATPVWTTYTYDGIGRTLTSTTAGTDTTSTTTYLYQGNTVTVTDAAGKWKKYTMNALGQLVQVNEPNPVSSGGGSSTNYALSLNGAVASASSQYSSSYPVFSINDGDELGSNWGNSGGWNDAAGPPSWVEIDFAGQKTINEIDVYTLADCFPNCASITPSQTATSYGISDFQVQYDNAGSWQTVPGGSISGNTLAWNKLAFSSVTTGKIRVNITAVHGGFSRLVELEAWGSGGGGNGSEYFTYYSYDSLGHLTGVSMPRATGTQTRTFNYGNPPGAQLLSATNPENGTVSYTYNSDHTLATKTDAKNQQVQYSYDSYKRVTQIRRGTYSGGTFSEDTCQQENYYYDAGQYGLGRLTSMQYKGGLAYFVGNPVCDHTFTETFTYNSPGGMTSQSLGVSEPAQNYSQGGNISMALTANYTYDNEGRMTATQYPSAWNGSSWVSGPNLGNTFDGMGRLQKLTDLTASSDIIANATYAPTGQLLTMTGASGAPNETRTYNSIGQMTRLQSGSLDIQYAYPATQNNGKISSQYDSVSGEQITYTYDSLNRLASATGSGWGQSYNYDGFGNLTDQNVTSGTAPALHVTYDPATNRQTGECADANGNLCGSYYSYDVENRFVRKGASLDVAYSYRPGNKRVWKGANYVYNDQTNWSLPSTDEVTFWSITGQKLATYGVTQYQPGGYYTLPQLVATQTGANYYFGGKLVKNWTGYVTPDRLGSIGKYFPYGQERPSATTDGKEKFATYFRDSETGLDYADQRYHQVGMGRFMTPDPSGVSAVDVQNPTSWNMYAYVTGDPVNLNDPTGLDCASTPYYFNGAYQGTIGQIIGAQSDISILATAMYTESGHGAGVDVTDEEYSIGAVIMNRWEFVNKNWYLSSSAGGPSLNVSGWGKPGDSITSIVENPSQFAIYVSNGNGTASLSASAQRNLNGALNSSDSSSGCGDLAFAITLANGMWGERNDGNPLYLYNGLILTGFNSFRPAHPSAPYEMTAGSFGDANTFYGVPDGYVSETPRLLPPRRRPPPGPVPPQGPPRVPRQQQ